MTHHNRTLQSILPKGATREGAMGAEAASPTLSCVKVEKKDKQF